MRATNVIWGKKKEVYCFTSRTHIVIAEKLNVAPLRSTLIQAFQDSLDNLIDTYKIAHRKYTSDASIDSEMKRDITNKK